MVACGHMRVFPLLLLSGTLFAQAPPAAKPQAKKSIVRRPASAKPPATARISAKRNVPVTDQQKAIYALGLSLANSIRSFHLSPSELDLVKTALSDEAAGKPAVSLQEWQDKIRPLQESRFMLNALAQPGAVKTDSGLVFRVLTPGAGASPTASDTVKVNYRGTLLDGTEFDSSYSRNEPAQFPLNRVIPCWTEGVQKMKVGGKAQLVCPPGIAYGRRAQGPIPPDSTLVFEIELLDIVGAAQ